MKEQKKIGAPTKYKEEYNDIALKMCRLGAKDTDLADFFEVPESTINNWKKQFPLFLESIRKGKELSDIEVAESLYKCAIGYERKEIELKVVSKGNNAGSEVQAIPVIKYYPPVPTSQIFWLKNRNGRWWRDRVETNGDDKAPVIWNETRTYKGDKPKKK